MYSSTNWAHHQYKAVLEKVHTRFPETDERQMLSIIKALHRLIGTAKTGRADYAGDRPFACRRLGCGPSRLPVGAVKR